MPNTANDLFIDAPLIDLAAPLARGVQPTDEETTGVILELIGTPLPRSTGIHPPLIDWQRSGIDTE